MATIPIVPWPPFAGRARRPLLTDGRLFIVAADHTARGMLGVPGDPRDPSGPACGSVDGLVVEHDQDVIGRPADVELKPVGAGLDRRLERPNRAFGRVAPGRPAAMGDHREGFGGRSPSHPGQSVPGNRGRQHDQHQSSDEAPTGTRSGGAFAGRHRSSWIAHDPPGAAPSPIGRMTP